MLRGQGGYKIQLELAIPTPGCPLKRVSEYVLGRSLKAEIHLQKRSES